MIPVKDLIANAVLGAFYGYIAAFLLGIENKLLAVVVLATYWTLAMFVHKLNALISERSAREVLSWKDEYTRFGIIAWLALMGVLSGVTIERADTILVTVTIAIIVLVVLALYGLIKAYSDE